MKLRVSQFLFLLWYKLSPQISRVQILYEDSYWQQLQHFILLNSLRVRTKNSKGWSVAVMLFSLLLITWLQINYKGFRLIATTILPIGFTTLIYGSMDGGTTIKPGDSVFISMIQEATRQLNLKMHTMGEKGLYTAVDTEGHLGKDGRYYVVDCARLFPPERPVGGVRNCYLYRLLR